MVHILELQGFGFVSTLLQLPLIISTDPFLTAYRLFHVGMQHYGSVLELRTILLRPSLVLQEGILILVSVCCSEYHKIPPCYSSHSKCICKMASQLQSIFIPLEHLLLEVAYQGREHPGTTQAFWCHTHALFKKRKEKKQTTQLQDAKKTSSLQNTCSHFKRSDLTYKWKHHLLVNLMQLQYIIWT